MFLANDMINPQVCSAVEMVLPSGVFHDQNPHFGGHGDVNIVNSNSGATYHFQVGGPL